MVQNAWLLLLIAFSWQFTHESTEQVSLDKSNVEDVKWGDWQEDVRCGIRYGEELYQVEIHVQNRGKDTAYLVQPTVRLCPSHSGQKSCFETKVKTGYATTSEPAFLVVPTGIGVDRRELVRGKQVEGVEKKYIYPSQLWIKVPAGDSFKQTQKLAYSKWRIGTDNKQYILPPVFPIVQPETIPIGQYVLQLQTGLLVHVDLIGPVRGPRRDRDAKSGKWLDYLPKMEFPIIALKMPDPAGQRIDLFSIKHPTVWEGIVKVGSTTTIDVRATVEVKGDYFAWGLKVAPPREISLFYSDESRKPVGERLVRLRDDGERPDGMAGDWHYGGRVEITAGSRVGHLDFVLHGESPGAMPFSSSTFFVDVVPDWVPTEPASFKGRVVEKPNGARFVSDEVLVSFEKGTGYDAIKQVFDGIEGRAIRYRHLSKIWVVKIPDTPDGSGVFDAVRELQANPLVVMAGPNTIYRLQ